MDKSTRIKLETREITQQHCKRSGRRARSRACFMEPGYPGSLPFYVTAQALAPIARSGALGDRQDRC